MKHRRPIAFILGCLAVVTALGSAGCGPMDLPQGGNQTGPGRRPQQLALTPEEEFELGQEAYTKVLRDAQGRILPADRPEVRKSRAIMARLVRAVGIEPLQREINLQLRGYDFDWELNVIQSGQVNAFCLPGGRMIVFTGILAVAANDDQLATVISHEISHALAHHASERVARDQSGGASFLRSKAYDRQQESEADHIGVFLMTFANFNPQETIRFWQRMDQAAGRGEIPEFLSDHPSSLHRVQDLQKWVPQALAGKQAFDAGRIARN